MYRFLADTIVVTHLGYLLFVVLGLLAILVGAWRRSSWVRNFWFRSLHLAAIGIVALEAILGVTCPLTNWEKQFRTLAGEAAHQGTFVGYWAHRVVFVDLPESTLTLAYCLFGLATLLLLWAIPPRRPNQPPPAEKK